MKRLCKCGHNHMSWVADLGPDEDEEGYDKITSCECCDCEQYEERCGE